MPIIRANLATVLTLENPVLDLSSQRVGAVTKNPDYKPLSKDDILPWTDFTLENIAAAFEHLFDIGPLTVEAFTIDGYQARIQKESDVNRICELSHITLCRWPIKKEANVIQKAIGAEEHDVTPKLGKYCKRGPGWSVFLRDEKRTVIVGGDLTCSSKWKSDISAATSSIQRSNWIWPFRQLLTSCVDHSTRYAFIFTPDEVVPLRVVGSGDHWVVEHASIPFENYAGTI